MTTSGIQAMGTGGGTMNISWNTFWDVKTARDEKGWYVEMRIPFSSLRFQSVNDIVNMGMIISRAVSSRNEVDTYPAIDPKYGNYAIMKPSLSADVEFEGVVPQKPVYITPYILGGYARNYSVIDPDTFYTADDKPKLEAGLDVKYSLTSNLTLDLTVNTDFAQVEADDQQVNLTRYSLYFPEKRLFFQERSSVFSYRLGGNSDMFYSRNIGIEDGNKVRIFGGAKLIGRAGKWDIGFLDMQTQEFDTIPSNNFGVLRLRRQVFNPNSYIGFLTTSKIGINGTYDIAYGIDGIIKVKGDDYLDIKFAQNIKDTLSNNMASLNPSMIRVNWERRTQKGFSYNLTYAYFGEYFDPQMGFLKYTQAQGFDGELKYGWLHGVQSKLFRTSAYLQGERMARLPDGKLEMLTITSGIEIFSKSGLGGRLEGKVYREGLFEDLPLPGNITVPAGDYQYFGFEATLFTPQTKPFYVVMLAEGGQYYDGSKISITLRPVISISQSLQVSGSYQFDHVSFPVRDQYLNSHVANMKLLYMFSTKLSASLLVQYNSTTSNMIGNFRLRYNPKEGNDFYLVIDENRHAGRKDDFSDIPPFYGRSITIKYSHTFRL